MKRAVEKYICSLCERRPKRSYRLDRVAVALMPYRGRVIDTTKVAAVSCGGYGVNDVDVRFYQSGCGVTLNYDWPFVLEIQIHDGGRVKAKVSRDYRLGDIESGYEWTERHYNEHTEHYQTRTIATRQLSVVEVSKVLAVLNFVTIQRADAQYKALVGTVLRSERCGWEVSETQNGGLELREQRLSEDRLKWMQWQKGDYCATFSERRIKYLIECTYSSLDVICSEEFWVANSDLGFSEHEKKGALWLLGKLDIAQYQYVDLFKMLCDSVARQLNWQKKTCRDVGVDGFCDLVLKLANRVGISNETFYKIFKF